MLSFYAYPDHPFSSLLRWTLNWSKYWGDFIPDKLKYIEVLGWEMVDKDGTKWKIAGRMEE